MAENNATAPEAPATKAPVIKKPVFSLERLRQDCYKLFGVSASTFDGATLGLKGQYPVGDLKKHIDDWQNRPVQHKAARGGI